MSEFLYKYEQLYWQNKEFIESGGAEFSRYPHELFDEMRSHVLLSWNKPSPAHSAELTALKVSKYPTLHINERQKEMLLSLSADLQLDEVECFELAMDLSTPGVKQWLEEQLDLDEGRGGLDFPEALRELFFFRKTRMLMLLFDLLKARASGDEEGEREGGRGGSRAPSLLDSKKKETVMRLTNDLFKDGLGSRIMVLITEQLQQLLDQTKLRKRTLVDKIIQYLQRLAECLFYMFYKTQITRPEADQLLELIRVLSNALIPTLEDKVQMPSPATAASTALATTASGEAAAADVPVDVSLFPTLVILQLTHVRALNQVEIFYSRDVDIAPYGYSQQGNALLDDHDTDWDYGKSLLGTGAALQWENRMVRGFTCLSLGVIREPLVEALTMNPGETTVFFDKAFECNAYSYVRLCLLPTIQGYDDLHSVDSADFRDLLLSTLVGESHSGLIVDLMNCFVNEVYHMEFPFNEWGRQRDLERRRYDLDVEVYEAGDGGGGAERVLFTENPDDNAPIACDCVDDILDMLTVTVMAQPAFAKKLMHSNGSKHPFVVALIDIVDKEWAELKYPAMRFFTALANSQQQNFAFNIYSLINTAKASYNEMFDWKDYFKIIENSTLDLQQLASGQGQHLHHHLRSNLPPPTPPDEYFLEDTVNLLGAVMRDPRVTLELVAQNFDPVRKLFNLLVCQIGVTLKGAILRALASLSESVSLCKQEGGGKQQPSSEVTRLELLEQVWLYMEEYQLLPACSAVGGASSKSKQNNYGGLHYELEQVESGALGQYPVTLGFLTLLVALLDQGRVRGEGGEGSSVPHNLGYGKRLPGVVCYIDYLLGEVLLKLETRRYLPANFSGEGQKWKVAALSVRVLTVVLQQYNINSLTAEDVRQSQQGQPCEGGGASIFESPSEELASLALDFQDCFVSYPLLVAEAAAHTVSTAPSQQLVPQLPHQQALLVQPKKVVVRDEMRPKSVGFAVMSSLLDQNRGLLLFLIQILQENTPKNISYIRQQEMLHSASLAVQDCMENSELSMCRVREEIAAKCREIQPPDSSQYYQYHHQQQRQYQQQQQQQQDQPHVSIFFEHVIHGTEVGWDDMFYDNAHWRMKAAAGVVGLLYEASLREVAFMERIRSAGPLTMTRSTGWGGGGGQTRNATSMQVEVQVVPLSTSLVTDLHSFQLIRQQGQRQGRVDVESELPLSSVLAYLSFLPEKKTLYCVPSLEILSLRILKHVAQNQTNKKVLHSLKDMGVNAQKMIENCNYFIENGNFSTEDGEQDWDQDESGPLCGWGGYSAMRHSGSVGEVAAVWTFTRSQVAAVRPTAEIGSGGGGDSKRGAVLDLLLSTLRPQDDCLCHYLLFGLGGISGALASSAGEGLGGTGPGPHLHSTVNCLEAILDLISVGGGGGDIVVDDRYVAVTSPLQAEQCFELIYRLYASPLTAPAIKHLVARRTHDQATGHFMINYLKYYLEFRRKRMVVGGGREAALQLEDSARLNCCAWALKVVALELALHSHANENENIEQILKVLFHQHAEYVEDTGAPPTSDTTSNLLLQLMQLVPLSLEFNFGASNTQDASEAVLLQCMRESSKPFVLGQGRPHQFAGRRFNFNEPPGGFLFVDIPHCILLLKTYFQYAAPTSAGSSRRQSGAGGLDGGDVAAKINNAVQVALEYNTYISAMASMSNFCHAFRQVIEMALFKYSTVLLGNYQLDSFEDQGGWLGQQELEGGPGGRERQVLHTAGSAIHQLVTYVLDPCLALLLRSPSMEMVHAEQLAAALLAMFDCLRCITLEASAAQEQCGAVSTIAPPPLTATRYGDLLTKLVLAILRRGSPGAPRHASSAQYRSKLYMSFFSLLQCGADMGNGNNSSGGVGYSVHADTRQHCRELLQTYVVELVAVLGDDIALGTRQQIKEAPGDRSEQDSADDASLVSCASSAFSALTGVLAILGPAGGSEDGMDRAGLMMAQQQHLSAIDGVSSKRFRDAEYLSPGYLHGLHTLTDRGCLVRVLSSVGLTTATAASTGGQQGGGGNFKRQRAANPRSFGSGAHLNSDVHALEAALSLCAHLACSSDGTSVLLELGVFGAVNSLPLLPIPTNSRSHVFSSSRREEGGSKDPFSVDNLDILLQRNRGSGMSSALTSTESQWLKEENVEAMLSLLLLLFRAALSHSSTPPPAILGECALFLSRHQGLCAHFLRLQTPSLAGLRVAHAIVSLFCLVASAPISPSSSSDVSLPSWESRMGAKGDALTSELSKLLAALGATPLPDGMCPPPPTKAGDAGSRRSSSSSSWWGVVVPCSEAEDGLQRSLVDTPDCLRVLAASRSLLSSSLSSGSSCQWSRFDLEKFQLGMKIIERSTSFFRIRCNQWVKLAAAKVSSADQVAAMGGGGSDDNDLSSFYDKLGLGLLKFDFDVLSFTFQSLGNLYLQLSREQDDEEGGAQRQSHSQAWLKSPFVFGGVGLEGRDEGQQQLDDAIRAELLRAVESLLCAVFDIANACVVSSQQQHARSHYHQYQQQASSMDHDVLMTAELQQCVQITSRFPAHSFVHQIGRMLLADINN